MASTATRGSISVMNIFIIIFAILIMCLSLHEWNDYLTATYSILIAIGWTCCLFAKNNLKLSTYVVFMIIDMLLLLISAIYHSVLFTLYNHHCNSETNDPNEIQPIYGCADWNRWHKARVAGILACFYLGFFLRLCTVVFTCLLARNNYNAPAGY